MDGRGKGVGAVGDDEVYPGGRAEALGADRRRDDGTRHGERFQDLPAHAGSEAHRRDDDPCPGEVRPDVGNGPRHVDAATREIGGRVVADDAHARGAAEAWEHVADEEAGGVEVRGMVEVADEDEVDVGGGRRRVELGAVDADGAHGYAQSRDEAAEARGVLGGHRDQVVGAAGGAQLEVEVAEVAVERERRARDAATLGAPRGGVLRETDLVHGEDRRHPRLGHEKTRLDELELHEVVALGADRLGDGRSKRRIAVGPADDRREKRQRVVGRRDATRDDSHARESGRQLALVAVVSRVGHDERVDLVAAGEPGEERPETLARRRDAAAGKIRDDPEEPEPAHHRNGTKGGGGGVAGPRGIRRGLATPSQRPVARPPAQRVR